MESDNPSIDSEEEAENLKHDVYHAQKMIQESGASEERNVYERFDSKFEQSQEGNQSEFDPAPEGSPEIQVLNAAEKGKLDVINQLVKDHPDLVNAHDRDGYTPLHRACYSNQPEVVTFLLRHGADVNARTCDNWTPLHSACKWNNFKCAAILLDYGSEVNPLTNGGQTPLHLASSHPEAKETLYLLLTHPKIATNIRNKTGELAYDLAHRHCKYYMLFEMCDPCFNII